jgi:hypothetical protein
VVVAVMDLKMVFGDGQQRLSADYIIMVFGVQMIQKYRCHSALMAADCLAMFLAA